MKNFITLFLCLSSLNVFSKDCFLKFYEARKVIDTQLNNDHPNSVKKCVLSVYKDGNNLGIELYTDNYANQDVQSVISTGSKQEYSSLYIKSLLPGVVRNFNRRFGSSGSISKFAEILHDNYLFMQEMTVMNSINTSTNRTISIKLDNSFSLDEGSVLKSSSKMWTTDDEEGQSSSLNIECSDFRLVSKEEMPYEYSNNLLCFN